MCETVMGLVLVLLRPASLEVRVALSAKALTCFAFVSARSTISLPIVVVSVVIDSLSTSIAFARFSIAKTVSR